VSGFLIAPAAYGDLNAILEYYAVDLQNPDAADRILEELFLAFRKLSTMPGMGHLRNDLANEPLRYWSVRNYLVIYRSERRPIQIVRVLHAARDVRSILCGESVGE
jgi:plasmid stabilization system protein ParE